MSGGRRRVSSNGAGPSSMSRNLTREHNENARIRSLRTRASCGESRSGMSFRPTGRSSPGLPERLRGRPELPGWPPEFPESRGRPERRASARGRPASRRFGFAPQWPSRRGPLAGRPRREQRLRERVFPESRCRTNRRHRLKVRRHRRTDPSRGKPFAGRSHSVHREPGDRQSAGRTGSRSFARHAAHSGPRGG